MKRLFTAIKIVPGEIALAQYYRLKQSLQQEQIKWVVPENFHLTLKFFGETPEDEIERINAIHRSLAGQFAPFKTRLSGTGIFGSRYAPRVIWFGFSGDESLKNLGTAVMAELSRNGYENDRQNFVPHLTVGRIRELRDKRHFQSAIHEVSQFESEWMEVEEMILYESILKPAGPVYSVIEKYALEA